MNIPELIEASEINIIMEYERNPDIKHVAKVFDITQKEVREVLKQAGIRTRKRKNSDYNALREVGMSERDFYHEPNN